MPGLVSGLQSASTPGLLAFRRHWKLLTACIVLATTLGLGFVGFRGARYTAATQFLVYVKEVQPGSELVISLGRADATQVENEIELIRSRGALAKVVKALALTEDPEFVPPVTPLREIGRWLLDLSPRTAEESQSRQDIAIAALAKRLAVRRVGASHTVRVEVTTSDPVKSARIANEISRIMAQTRLGAEQGGDRSPLLRERLQGLGPSVYVLTPALVPEHASGPRKILIVPGAALLGLFLGSALVMLRDLSDRTVRSAAQIEQFGLDCIGAIPRRADGGSPRGSKPAGAELAPLATQTLLRMVVAAEAAQARVVGIATPAAGEDVTAIARRFAEAAARNQRKVLLVDPDRLRTSGLRRHGAHRGDEPAIDVLGLGTDDGVSVWAASQDMVLAGYDLVVVGLPPLEHGAAFRAAARRVDGIVLVAPWGRLSLERAQRAFSIAGVDPSDFIGAVLDQVDGRVFGRLGDTLWRAQARVAARRRLSGAYRPREALS